MKLKKNAQVGELMIVEKSEKNLVWNGYAWDKSVEEVADNTVFIRKASRDVTREIPDGEINDVNYIFMLEDVPLSGSEQVYLNGILQKRGTGRDYTIVENRLYFVEPPMIGSVITCTYSTSSNTELRGEIPIGDIDGENEMFVLQRTPVSGTEHIFLNGILQAPGENFDYVLKDNLLVFNEAPAAGSLVICDYSFV
jgi:hypothetical protein